MPARRVPQPLQNFCVRLHPAERARLDAAAAAEGVSPAELIRRLIARLPPIPPANTPTVVQCPRP